MISIQFLYQHQPPGSLHLSYYTSLVSFYQENCCTMTEKKTKKLELILVWHETMLSWAACIPIKSVIIIQCNDEKSQGRFYISINTKDWQPWTLMGFSYCYQIKSLSGFVCFYQISFTLIKSIISTFLLQDNLILSGK